MLSAFERGDVDMVGLGRPLISDPVTPARLLAGEWTTSLTPEAAINPFNLLPWFNVQIERLADGAEPDLTLAGEVAVAEFMAIEERAMRKLLEYRAAVES
jgi:hypothetical protein